MLPIHMIQEIKRLLDDGQESQRAIARRLRVGRGTVNAIALGRRGLHGRETPCGVHSPTAEPERCPGCGMLVEMPCVYCRAVKYAGRRKPTEAAGTCGPGGQAA